MGRAGLTPWGPRGRCRAPVAGVCPQERTSASRLGSTPTTDGPWSLRLFPNKQTAKPACMKPDYSNLLTSRIMQ